MATLADEPTAVSITCGACGEVFVWSASEQDFYRDHKLVRPRRCPPCRDRGQQPGPRSCRSCGRLWTLTVGEIEFYLSMRRADSVPYRLPRRCKSCRSSGKPGRVSA